MEAGKVANLVILDANSLQDIDNTRKIHAVVRGGRMFDAIALQVILSAAQSKVR